MRAGFKPAPTRGERDRSRVRFNAPSFKKCLIIAVHILKVELTSLLWLHITGIRYCVQKIIEIF